MLKRKESTVKIKCESCEKQIRLDEVARWFQTEFGVTDMMCGDCAREATRKLMHEEIERRGR